MPGLKVARVTRCRTCKKAFKARSNRAEHCSHTCYMRAYRHKKRLNKALTTILGIMANPELPQAGINAIQTALEKACPLHNGS